MRDKTLIKVEDIKEMIMEKGMPSPAPIRAKIKRMGEDVFYGYLDVPVEREILAKRCDRIGADDIAQKLRSL